jgi:hypothetical protein
MKLYAILDDLEHVSAEDLRAEIALCERRIAWCHVFLELLSQQSLRSQPSQQTGEGQDLHDVATSHNGAPQPPTNGVVKLRASRNGEPTLWKRIKDHLEQCGPQSTPQLGALLQLDNERVQSYLWKYPQLFRRDGEVWRLSHAEE